MEDFIASGITGDELAELKRFQQFLHDICISDILMVDGTTIYPSLCLLK